MNSKNRYLVPFSLFKILFILIAPAITPNAIYIKLSLYIFKFHPFKCCCIFHKRKHSKKRKKSSKSSKSTDQKSKKRGTPFGHKGTSRKKPEEADKTVVLQFDSCPHGGGELNELEDERVRYEEE